MRAFPGPNKRPQAKRVLTLTLIGLALSARLRAKFFNNLAGNLCGRSPGEQTLTSAVAGNRDQPSHYQTFELKSLILAQIERWRHA
jgi:hypothetical protein